MSSKPITLEVNLVRTRFQKLRWRKTQCNETCRTFFKRTGNKVSAQKMNKIIEEIGWTRGYSGGGYEPTKQGLRKDVLRLESQRGTPYCSYPPGIIHDLSAHKSLCGYFTCLGKIF